MATKINDMNDGWRSNPWQNVTNGNKFAKEKFIFGLQSKVVKGITLDWYSFSAHRHGRQEAGSCSPNDVGKICKILP